MVISDLLQAYPPAVRAALYEAAALIPGIELLGAADHPAGPCACLHAWTDCRYFLATSFRLNEVIWVAVVSARCSGGRPDGACAAGRDGGLNLAAGELGGIGAEALGFADAHGCAVHEGGKNCGSAGS